MAKTKQDQAAEKAVTDPEWRKPCDTLADVRAHIDRLDALIAPLMAQRLHFVKTAARFKPSKEAVIVQARVEEIVQTVRRLAEQYGANPDVIERVYRTMIDDFTLEEQKNWDKVHK
ncbi:MAG: chorismate mutase [Rhodospirillaceae bacterium]|nr:chorismate mutase [Rhodospirillaceae bacterium]